MTWIYLAVGVVWLFFCKKGGLFRSPHVRNAQDPAMKAGLWGLVAIVFWLPMVVVALVGILGGWLKAGPGEDWLGLNTPDGKEEPQVWLVKKRERAD